MKKYNTRMKKNDRKVSSQIIIINFVVTLPHFKSWKIETNSMWIPLKFFKTSKGSYWKNNHTAHTTERVHKIS